MLVLYISEYLGVFQNLVRGDVAVGDFRSDNPG